MNKRTEQEKLNIIANILEKRNSPDAGAVQNSIKMSKLPREVRERIVEVLSDELVENGLHPDGEPIEYGLDLEHLIDFCGLSHDE